MAKAQHEISQIISSLMIILWKHTDNLGIPHRPLGHDWTELQNHVSRLLTLRGMTQAGASIPEDPWNFILSEFGPTTALVLSASCLGPGGSMFAAVDFAAAFAVCAVWMSCSASGPACGLCEVGRGEGG
ncbi:hypothetical protein BDV32DRAFT_144042 [Aspergillus pseudonomiae]|uniref:Uncharacterized protein n=1 Tax=Aspergillus pseudonomiae TaxID=1506151 RepID=A0A5N6IHS5_9EURO|nr:uncharacterized protein BDV37DRAFT_247448 [Aspergillus pseudonomiae]KAB8266321.1 hypothetical protein BDV32DRAFT_144042 [Aspergillus pseudonomiae]KAE8404476.1 hypothetical protein BDV37DRAFT_247448 [Aspergillus pseudonomiae]